MTSIEAINLMYTRGYTIHSTSPTKNYMCFTKENIFVEVYVEKDIFIMKYIKGLWTISSGQCSLKHSKFRDIFEIQLEGISNLLEKNWTNIV